MIDMTIQHWKTETDDNGVVWLCLGSGRSYENDHRHLAAEHGGEDVARRGEQASRCRELENKGIRIRFVGLLQGVYHELGSDGMDDGIDLDPIDERLSPIFLCRNRTHENQRGPEQAEPSAPDSPTGSDRERWGPGQGTRSYHADKYIHGG